MEVDKIGICPQQKKIRQQTRVVRVFLQFNWSYGWELDVLYREIFMVGKFLVHAWNRCGGLHKEYSESVCSGQTHSNTLNAKTSFVLNEPI